MGHAFAYKVNWRCCTSYHIHMKTGRFEVLWPNGSTSYVNISGDTFRPLVKAWNNGDMDELVRYSYALSFTCSHYNDSLCSQLDVFHACPQGGCDREQFQSGVADLRRLDRAYARCIADLEARDSSSNAPPITDLAWEAPSLVEEFPSSAAALGGLASYQKADVLKSGRLSEGCG